MLYRRKLVFTHALGQAGAALSVAALVLTLGIIPAAEAKNAPEGTGSDITTLSDTPDANPETYVDEAGVVHYKFDPADFPGMTIKTEAGVQALDASCDFIGDGSGEATSEPGIEIGIEITLTQPLAHAARGRFLPVR